MDSALHAALAGGAVAVTPNRRLARALHREFALAAAARGARAWETPAILPYASWLETLWLDTLAADALPEPPRLLTPEQSSYFWRRIVAEESASRAPLLDARGAAALAAEAWELMHAWGAGGESWRGWPAAALAEDPASFARWAEAYAAALAQRHALDGAQLADALARHAPRLRRLRDRSVLLVGFTELSPQQSRLLAALGAAAMRVGELDPLPSSAGVASRASAATAHDELARALAWAREWASRPGVTIGVAVEGLAARRAEVLALAEEILCPALQWPGREPEPRPYNISLGEPLPEVPLAATALELIAFGGAPLPLARAAALLRSPYLDGGRVRWTRRAALEAKWLADGRRDVSFVEAIAALRGSDEPLAKRWQDALASARLPAQASPRGWTEAWRDWLAALGWPGDTPLTSAEYQARAAWDRLLVAFGSLGAIESRLGRSEATELLQSLATETVFQPEGPEVPVQILGLLEAQGLAFDALWVAGLSAERWPPTPQPHALLPLEWQRERNLPRSSAERELRYARALTARLLRAAPEVVMSHPEQSDEYPCAPSALISGLPPILGDGRRAPQGAAAAIHAMRPPLETIADDRAPALASAAHVPGGASLFEKQSECPFRAAAIHRLGADLWPAPAEGLSPTERGQLLHRALAALWRDLGDHAGLIALSDELLAERIAAAVAEATSAVITPPRRRALPPLVAATETRRLARIVREWVERHERPRRGFSVLGTELALPLSLSGIEVRLRLDRVDGLDSGSVAIIDYKSGRTVAPAKWFEARPQAPQLALYALAWRARYPTRPVRALAYAQLKAGEIGVQGLGADESAWAELRSPASLRGAGLRGWNDAEVRWGESLSALAAEIARGAAAVAPRDAETCRRCGLHALCRIGAPAGVQREASEDD